MHYRSHTKHWLVTIFVQEVHISLTFTVVIPMVKVDSFLNNRLLPYCIIRCTECNSYVCMSQ